MSVLRYYKYLVTSINKLKDENLLYDVTLIADGKKIQAHKIILASVSDYFKKMFTDNFSEKNSNEINMSGIDFNSLSLLINFIYSGNLNINQSNVEILLYKADYLQITSVVTLCEKFMIRKLNQENCLRMYYYAKKFCRKELENVAMEMIIKNILKIVSSPEFNSICISDLKIILSNEKLNVIDEDLAAYILSKWLNKNKNTVKKCPLSLLKTIKKSLLCEKMIELLLNIPSIYNNYDCVKYLTEKTHKQTPRKRSQGYIIAVGGKNPLDLKTPVEVYSPFTNSWATITHMLKHRHLFSVAVIEDTVYIVGGTFGYMPTSSVSTYNIKTKSWKETTPLTSPRHGCALVSNNKKIYVIGGKGYYKYVNSVEYWKPGFNSWKRLPPLNEPRTSIGAVISNKVIFIFGGIKESLITGRSECVDCVESLSKHGWVSHTPIPEARACLAVAAVDKYIYIAGGYIIESQGKILAKTNKVYKYDTVLKIWSFIPNLITPRNDSSMCVLGNKIYVIGGFTGNGYTNSVEEYNIKKNKWKYSTSCSTFKYGQCSCVYSHFCSWKYVKNNNKFIKLLDSYF
ncbi:Kelch-like protein [Tanapox virus]|uniref:Kelch-like protein n=1 Tax=Tanapox virus TaxID=99000 RepID=A7XCS9_9POXV|nr:Kelch-like protein [Tanapox virus]ABQ43771.1 Kelch-like protein [Tanapox virus]